MEKERSYEVETRLYFNSDDEAFNALPFLKECLTKEIKWVTKTFSIDLFKVDKLLRVSNVYSNNLQKVFLGYKEPDIGNQCNIRLELDEDITNVIENSKIIKLLGGKDSKVSPENIVNTLETLGHKEFMVFNGFNLTGKHSKLGLSLKLMYCETLQHPIMLELEKTATTLEEAHNKEMELLDLIEKYNLSHKIIKKEPPTLLYEKIFSK